jgi:hypothetical protein
MAFVAASLFSAVCCSCAPACNKAAAIVHRTQQRIVIIARTPLGVSKQHMSSFPLPLQRRSNLLPKV